VALAICDIDTNPGLNDPVKKLHTVIKVDLNQFKKVKKNTWDFNI